VANHISVTIPNSKTQLTRVHKAVHRQQNYEHDFTRITFRDWAVEPSAVKAGRPIQFTLDGKKFYGYIHDVKSHQTSNQNITELSIIGASYVMRQASQTVYRDMTADQVVTKIAKKYGFAYKVTPHPRVFPHISQAGMTDWQLMVKLAKQCGYFLRAENTAIYFQPLLQDFDELIYEAKSFAKADAGIKSGNIMYNFRPVIGETLAHHGADKAATSIAGVNPSTGQQFKYTKQKRSATTRKISHPELFDRHDTHVVVNDYKTAIHEANSADDKSRFPYTAEAEVIGMSDLRPGMPIYLSGVGSDYSGYWTILNVEHQSKEETLNDHTYTSILSLGTDSLGAVASSKYPKEPSSKPARLIKPNVKNTKIKATTVLNSTGLNIMPVKTSKLISQVNRASSSGKSVSAAVWKSTQGNLNRSTKPNSVSSAVKAKAVANRARS